jgi:hypothetical protein
MKCPWKNPIKNGQNIDSWLQLTMYEFIVYMLENISVSEWLLFNADSATLSAISWREQVKFQWDVDEVRFVLEQHA